MRGSALEPGCLGPDLGSAESFLTSLCFGFPSPQNGDNDDRDLIEQPGMMKGFIYITHVELSETNA